MNILFRVDCNKQTGFGHMVRCYLIAKYMLEKYNFNIFFLTRNFDFSVFKIKTYLKKISNYKSTKFSEKKDLLKTLEIIKKKKIDVIILDHYKCTKYWCNGIKKKLVIIDDGFKKRYKKGLYIDYSQLKKTKKKNNLVGLKYFPMDEKYVDLKQKKIVLKNDVFINLGSGKFENYLRTIIYQLSKLKEIKKIIIVGKKLKNIPKTKIKIKFIKSFSFLGSYIKSSKICIGAGGVNLIERLFLEKKNIVFSTAKHQEKICTNLNKFNFIHYLGKIYLVKEHVKSNKFKNVITKILSKEIKFKKFRLVDGRGIRRISKSIYNLRYEI